MFVVLSVVFVITYVLITLEHPLKLNKSAIALAGGALLWVITSVFMQGHGFENSLHEHLASIAEIIFFLMGAMTIVEVIDSHDGFALLTRRITTRHKRSLLVILGCSTFFLSAVLDNLTTTIVMMAVMTKLVKEKRDVLVFTGILVIAANAGGAFSPIGDVTTTMLWIGGQISADQVIIKLFLPSLTAFAIPLGIGCLMLKGTLAPQAREEIPSDPAGLENCGCPDEDEPIDLWKKNLVLASGLLLLVMVPVFHQFTGLPPYMGILGALGLLWLLTELIHRNGSQSVTNRLTVSRALGEIDLQSMLFFTGILLAVAALETAGLLGVIAAELDRDFGDRRWIAVVLGFLSAVFDNVPLVAAGIQMYPLDLVGHNNDFWHLLSYTAGTGGSLLIIGSAAGVTAMGITKVSFGEYAKTIGPMALAGYLGGVGVFILQWSLAGTL